MNNDMLAKRRRWARAILALGALVELMVLSSWLRMHGHPGRIKAIALSVISLLLIAAGAATLRRLPRAAIWILMAGSVYAAIMMALSIRSAYSIAASSPHLTAMELIGGLAFTFAFLPPIPLALLIAWPLRSRVNSLVG
jgi:hypothetical protein